ncbi:MAG: PQQ-binding-like beta-propeller repeat protein [Verrucomicrobiota bacterium]
MHCRRPLPSSGRGQFVLFECSNRRARLEGGSGCPDEHDTVHSSFAVAGGVAVIICGVAVGLDGRTGAVLWRAEGPGGWADSVTSASVWRKTNIIYGGRKRLCCLESKTGKVVWELPGEGRDFHTYGSSTPVVSGDMLAAFSEGELRGFDLSSGLPREIWHLRDGGDFSTPAGDAHFLYIVGAGSFGKDKPTQDEQNQFQRGIMCCELQTGKVAWVSRINPTRWTSPIVADGKLFIMTDEEARIAMIDVRDGKLLGTAGIRGREWTSPAIANGRLFVHPQGGVTCYDLTVAGKAPFNLQRKELEAAREESRAKAEAAAVAFNQAAADRGDPYGLLRMGERYRDGEGVAKDLPRAREYLVKAAAAGNAQAAKSLQSLEDR